MPAAWPIPRLVHVKVLLLGEDGLTILASPEGTDGPYPLCRQRSDRVHGRYARWPTSPGRSRRFTQGSKCRGSCATTPPVRARSSLSAWTASPRWAPAGPSGN